MDDNIIVPITPHSANGTVEAGVEASSVYKKYLEHVESMHRKATAGEYSLSPETLWMSITENCNLKCIGCYTEGLFKKIYVELEDIRKILVSSNRPYKMISLTEGEAFLHPKLCDIIELCRETHPEAEIFVISNGTIPIKGRYRDAVAMIDRLGLSIDGATRETYESIRRGARFDRFLQNVREIVQVRKQSGYPRHIGFSFTATRTNLRQLADVVRMAHDLGVDEVFAQPMEMKDPEIVARIADIHIETMPRSERDQCVREARDVARSLGVQFSLASALEPVDASCASTTAGATPLSSTAQQKIEDELSVRMCQYLWGEDFQLVQDGNRFNVLPCCYMLRSAAGVAADRYGLSYEGVRPLDEIYNSEAFWKLRRDLANGKLADLCGDCAAAKSYPWTPSDDGPTTLDESVVGSATVPDLTRNSD